MDLIFKSPYHTHFLMDFNVSSFNMHVKELYSWVFIHIIFIISLTTFNPSLKQCYHNRLQTHNKENFVHKKIINFSRFNYLVGFGLYEYCFQS